MTNEPSPRPWRVMRYTAEDEPDRIIDANGDEVAIELLEADAQLIVDAVNERDRLAADEAHYRTDNVRLRDIVRRLCDELESHYYEPQSMDDRSVIREARAALGEAAP